MKVTIKETEETKENFEFASIDANGPFYISIASDRSVNAIQEGSDDIETYNCTTYDPSKSDEFDRWANTSESMVGEFETVADIVTWFEKEMSNRPTQIHEGEYGPYGFGVEDIRKAFQEYDFDEDDGTIFSFTAYAGPFENDFYIIPDPDGAMNDGQDMYPIEKEGVSILWGIDTGTSTKVENCEIWYQLIQIEAVAAFIAKHFNEDSLDDLADLEPGHAQWDDFIEILEKNGYETDHCQSPGHLDASSSPGTGSVYDYVFIRKAD